MMNSKQSGFTLIELVVVITILGILAAVALPKFTNLQRDARISKLNGARAAVGAASAMIHGTWLTRSGVTDTTACAGGGFGTNIVGVTATPGTVCTEAGLVEVVNAYPGSPAATNAGIISAAGITSQAFIPTAAQLATEGFSVTIVAGTSTRFEVIGGPDVATCSFVYNASTAANTAPVISGVTTTGC